jgi:hypothetical protein
MDYYTLTLRDTTVRETVKNAPGSSQDNGVVFPSSRETHIIRESTQYDSTFERDYPAFIRYGGIEFDGLITNSDRTGVGAGLFGVYSLLDTAGLTAKVLKRPHANFIFKGFMLRVLPVEYRLRWFDDAPNWTIGTSFEYLAQDETRRLYSFANVYIRKYYWIRDKVPYVILEPYFGLSLFPSSYVNVGAELHLGSYGGFNLRAYAGYAGGFYLFKNVSGSTTSPVNFPYVGLGVSALDFTNRVVETEHEWKDYMHSAIEVSALDIVAVHSFASYHNALDTTLNIPLNGGFVRFATAHFPLPWLDNHFWVGTSLFNLMFLGFKENGLGVLPVRFGYRKYFIAEDLSLEPFLELNYFPSVFVNVAARLRLDTFSGYTLGIQGGYAAGSSGAFLSSLIFQNGGGSVTSANFGTFYLGISIGLKDYMLTPERVAYERAHELP